MLKDQQGNTRTVLTEEVHREYHECSMETTNAARKDYEERTFGNVDDNGAIPASNEVVATREPTQPDWGTNTSGHVSALVASATDAAVGPNAFLKVMAGDQVSARVDYLYRYTSYRDPKPDRPLLQPLINVLINNFNNGVAGSLLKNSTTAVQGQLTYASGLEIFLESQETYEDMPKAFLTWLFFDEQMNFIPPDGLGGGSGSLQIEQEGDDACYLLMRKVVAPKNGYAFVFVSNQNKYRYVYFDNLKVTHERGRLLEESTYYPDGLKIAGLCAKAFNKLPNEFGYQGNYAEEEEESGYDEFALRHYDPTIARWLSTDPYNEFASPYVGMGNDPVNNVDPDGGSAIGKILRPRVPVGALSKHTTPGVGQYGGTAQGTNLSTGSSAATGSSGGGGGGGIDGATLNAAGNVAAGIVGQWVADKLFPLPQGPDANNLQQPIKQEAPISPAAPLTAKTIQPGMSPTVHFVDVGGINDPSNADLPDVLKYGTAQIQIPIVQQFLRLIFGGAAGGITLAPPSTDWVTPMWRDLKKKVLEMEIDIIIRTIKHWLPSLPPYPSNPLLPPAPGWQWRGRPGSVPGSKDGNWYNPGTDESLHPDLGHPAPVGPHWDYKDPDGTWWRWYPDGTMEQKKD